MTKILVIEDNPSLRESIVDVLAELGGYEVMDAPNGRIGVETAKANLPDLIVCDIEMPKLDGYGVISELQQDETTATIPFVFLTAKSDQESTRHGMALGADDYIAKPFDPPELLTAIEARLSKQKTLASHYQQKMTVLRDNILYALPHELRTPLTGIIGMAELMAYDVHALSHEEIAEFANDIAESGYRLLNLVENYLVYAQLELIAADLERVASLREGHKTKPDDIVQSVVMEKTTKNGRQVNLVLNAGECTAPISTSNLQKIVKELIDNAFKFSPPETAVTIATDIKNNAFILTITNEGHGMTPEQIRDIGLFMQFERRLYEQQGSGMGLTFVKRLVELHQGQLTISSVPGVETAVQVTLPL